MPSSERKISHARFAAGSVEAVRVWLLGGFRVSVGVRAVEEGEWRSRKAAALVKLLALSPNHRLHREQISALLWPRLDSKAASNNLHRSLYAARRTLGFSEAGSPFLRVADGRVALCPERPLRTDVEAFEEAATSARRARKPGAYRAAIELYAGELLPGDRYEAWTENRRGELRNLYLALLSELAELHEARGEFAPAIEASLRAAGEEPANEATHATLMRLYAASGRRREALGQYEKLESILDVELGARPDAETRRLHRGIQSGQLPTARPAERPPGEVRSRRHNLPEARTSFVGREREMAEVRRLLSMARLLTLTGSGGCGKTRLSLEVAGDLADAYPDGVWLVELASLSEPDLVLQAVAGALGAREHPDRPLVEAVCRHLRGKRTLLVLDNCEHLIDTCAGLTDSLLGGCPGLRVLATSREPLGVPGEAIWPVSPLSVPETEMEDPRSCEAVRLFVDRARSRLPVFDLTPANERAVAEVCRRLEGIPLAIELAAARVAALAVEQVAARLSDSLAVLTGGPRAADSRHQTLRATLDWSYDLLDKPERRLFGQLSVFFGGWTLEAAEAVGTDASAVPGLLASLVDKSLVAADEGASRYRMLETVRQYAGEKLEEGGEAEHVRGRHAKHYLALAERAEPEISGSRQVAWLERLETEHGNLRAALSWSLDGGAPLCGVEAGLRMAAALGRFWNVHGFAEGGEWLDKGLERGGDVSSAVRAKALRESGRISLFRGEHEKAVARLEEGLELYRTLGDGDGVATTLANLGFIMAHAGRRERVVVLREEAEALRREPLDRRSLAHLLTFLGLAALSEWDQVGATGPLEESLALSRELQDARGVAISLTGLGMTTLKQGDHERAAALFEENLRLLREQGDRMGIAYALLGLAAVAASRRQPARAARLWGAAEALREAVGLPLSPFDRAHYEYERRISEARSTLDEETWFSAWTEGRNMTPERAIEYALGTGEPAPSPASAPQQPSVGETGDALTPREREVADLIARGFSNRRIAAELSISERTVHNHVAKVLRKLGLRSRTQIAAWVIQHPS